MIQTKILIVDDRPENLLSLEGLLDDPGLTLIKANSGDEALAHTLDHDFALILMDVHMPSMDGYECAELMRGSKKTRDVPIIFVTADLSNRNTMFRGYESGAVDYLFKPLDTVVFRSKVSVFLDLYRQKKLLKIKNQELDAKLVELEELQQQLEETNEQLHMLSFKDDLTGLLNRRCFDKSLEEDWQRGLRDKTPLSLVLIDIDHFKGFNDTYGHVEGDQCLKQVAHTLEAAMQRHVDRVARYGGEEFAVILPGTDTSGALQVAERIRKAVEDLCIKHEASQTCRTVTISLGIGSIIPARNLEANLLIAAADNALFQAKASGRNQCCQAEKPFAV